MKKTFSLTDLECAHCASKMEAAIQKIDGVESVTVNFMLQNMTLEANDAQFETILKQIVKTCKKIEPDCVINC